MPDRRDLEAVKVRIVAAATHLFAERGYSATTTREIAEAAGVTKPMLYYYFPDKAGLYIAIVREALDGLDAALAAVVNTTAPPVERLSRKIRTYLEFFLANRPLASICFGEIFGLGEKLLHEMGRLYFDRVRGYLDQLVRQGTLHRPLTDTEREYIALSLLGIPNVFVLRYILQGQTFDVDAVSARVVEYYLAETH